MLPEPVPVPVPYFKHTTKNSDPIGDIRLSGLWLLAADTRSTEPLMEYRNHY